MASCVNLHGHLDVRDGVIVDAHGRPFALRGVSLFWSQWKPQFYQAETVRWLRRDWHVNAVRAAIAVGFGGYLQNPELEMARAECIVQAAVETGIYVIVDWHAHAPETAAAQEFFGRLAARHPDCPNLVYEIWNEPEPHVTWQEIVNYCDQVIPVVRRRSPRSLIVVGAQHYCQRFDNIARAPLAHDRIAYALHFYAASHGEKLRRHAAQAASAGLALLATEYGVSEASGDGALDIAETARWWDWLESRGIGHFNWSITDKAETSAALRPGAPSAGPWTDADLTASGRFVRDHLRSLGLD